MMPPTGLERQGIGEQVAVYLHQPALDAVDHQRPAAIAVEDKADLPLLRGHFRHLDERDQHLADIDRSRILARQLCIEPRRIGDIADQPVEAAHIVEDDVHQLLPVPPCPSPVPRSRRRCAASSGNFQFMGDIGGEPLVGVDAQP